MLMTKDLIDSAIKHFPKWMDIRKRHHTSNGGALITSIAEEVASIQDEIDSYVDSFFISYYEDKCETIYDFVYKANIGFVDTEKLLMVMPGLEITNNIDEFYKNKDLAYYQDGFIFVKNETNTIFYSIDGYVSEASTEKMHIWNVYDEFAVFVGIRRYESESNRQLYNRILDTSRRVINSSEDGLKNAIQSSLINLIPELDIKDITLERPTAKNLEKYYYDFEMNLDKLANVNKDVLRTKKWDLDKWEHQFKKIDYIPHIWDVILDEYTNGIGDKDDLKAFLLDSIVETDAEVSFYKKSDEQISTYIKDSNINDNLTLSLVKYNNVLNPLTANYKITASEVAEINRAHVNEPVSFELYRTTKGEHYRKLEDLVSLNNTKDITVSLPGRLTRGKYYKLKFVPTGKYDDMTITNCHVENENKEIVVDPDGNIMNYIKENEKFELNNGVLRNKKTKKFANKIYHFKSASNAEDTVNGIKCENISESMEMVLDLKGCESELLKINYNCDLSSVLLKDMIMSNFYYDANYNAYVSDTVDEEKSIEININANHCQFKVTQGQCIITAFVNNEMIYTGPPTYNNGDVFYATPQYSTSKNIKILITVIGNNTTHITNVLYNKYLLSLKTAKDILLKDVYEENLYRLPSSVDNELIITMRTYTQHSPVIKNIYIGSSLSVTEDCYETDLLYCHDDMLNLKVDSKCKVELYASNEYFDSCVANDKVKLTSDYSTDKVYTATSNEAYLILDMSEYADIENIILSHGTCEIIGTGNKQKYFVRLLAGQSISGITIDGYYNQLIECIGLNTIIKRKISSYNPYNDFLYVSGLTRNFIVSKNNGSQYSTSILSEDIINADGINLVKIGNVPDNIQVAFVTRSNSDIGDYITIGKEKSGVFDSIYLFSKDTKEYIAYNECVTIIPNKTDVKIINTFNNGYVDNKLMIYKIESMNTEEYSVSFNNKENWTVGKKTINIDFNFSLNGESFNTTKKVINENIKLESIIPLKETYLTENKEIIELSQYNIVEDSSKYKVIYNYDITNPMYDKAEFIQIKSDGFNKLKHTNILDIKYIGYDFNSEDTMPPSISNDKYELMKDEGILIWKDSDIINEQPKLYIIYSIKKAISIKYNMDLLYEKVHYPIVAYKKMDSVVIENIENNRKISLLNPLVGNQEIADKIAELYKSCDIVNVSCTQPGFTCEKLNDYLIFKKDSQENSLAVKTGWYYINNKEYYMFASNQSASIADDEYTHIQEVNRIDGELYFHKSTTNHVKNSKMSLNSMSNVYHLNNFKKLKKLNGSSRINSLTACDNYNNWKTFAMDMKLTKGLNDLGIYFTPSQRDVSSAYALLDITEYLSDKNYLSFYNPNNLNVFLGIEKNMLNVTLTDTTMISTMIPIIIKNDNNIYNYSFNRVKDTKYYIVVTGEGLIDDIILQDGEYPDVNLHEKNIDIIKFNLTESTSMGTNSRLFIEQSKGNKNNGTEIDNKGYIVNASNIDWNITKHKSYRKEKDWLTNFYLNNIGIVKVNDTDCILTTSGGNGKIVSKPIYIGDPKVINSVIYKINDIPIKSMQGIKCTMSQAQNINSSFTKCRTKYSDTSLVNYSSDLIYPYIQLSIEIPQNKVISNIEIYIDYKSNDSNAPIEKISNTGTFITKVLNTHNTADYKLKSLGIEDKTSDISLSIRGAKEGSNLSVWTNWKPIELDKNNNVVNNIVFEDYKFFQLKAELSNRNAKIKIKYLDLEVIR